MASLANQIKSCLISDEQYSLVESLADFRYLVSPFWGSSRKQFSTDTDLGDKDHRA